MNVIAYRQPHASEIHIFHAAEPEPFTGNNLSEGFVVSPFESAENALLFPYIKTLDRIPRAIVAENKCPLHFPPTSDEEYKGYVTDAINEIEKGSLNKIVTSGRKVINYHLETQTLFQKLCEAYPGAFVYFISCRQYGTWIGATPELLLARNGDRFSSMALAGTRPSSLNKDSAPWDGKNIREQAIVTEYIDRIFRKHGIPVVVGKTQTLKAGNIEHIMTMIEAHNSTPEVYSIIKDLSPTPALCGQPKKPALDFILAKEKTRGLYGGFGGPYESSSVFAFYVLIRCACLSSDSATLFAGGGITSLSNPEEELTEIKRKYSTLEKIFFG